MSSIDDSDIDEGVGEQDYPDEMRMVDWMQSWKAPFMTGSVIMLFSMIPFQGNGTALGRMMLVSVLAAIWALVSQLRGFYFNRKADQLSYPMFFFRRSVNLSKILDANCQIKLGEDDPINILARAMGFNQKVRAVSKRYIVNMSGDFGARRVIFHNKYKRDQFLSLLRNFAPQVRITRWT